MWQGSLAARFVRKSPQVPFLMRCRNVCEHRWTLRKGSQVKVVVKRRNHRAERLFAGVFGFNCVTLHRASESPDMIQK